MLFIPLAEIDRTTHNNYYEYSKQLPFGFKLLFAISLLFMLFSQIFIPYLGMANIPTRTFSLF